MNTLKYAVEDIKKMLNHSSETSVRISDRNIAWKILLFRKKYLESIIESGDVPEHVWSPEFTLETVPVKTGGYLFVDDDITISKASLPAIYKPKTGKGFLRVTSMTKQRHIDIVDENMFYNIIMSDDMDVLQYSAIATFNSEFIFVYPPVSHLALRIIRPLLSVSVDDFGWDTDLGMDANSLREAILEILTKDFQINAAAVADIVSDMKDQLLIMNGNLKK